MMKRLGFFLLNIVQWGFFCLWSGFWMMAAILYRVIFRDPNVPLSWARRFWGRGLVWGTRCRLTVVPGFVPQPGQAYIFAMNHQSMFDIVVACVAIPVNVRFIAKRVLKAIPFLGWYMMATGMVFIDRRNRAQAVRSLEEACRKIRGGASILVYPEGTRSTSGAILPFKKGPFVTAIQAGVPIVPVVIEGSRQVLPVGSARLSSQVVRVVMGHPIPTAGLLPDDRDALMQRVRDEIIDLNVAIGGRGGDKSHCIAPKDAPHATGQAPAAAGPAVPADRARQYHHTPPAICR